MSTEKQSFEPQPDSSLEECLSALADAQRENEELRDKYLRAAAAIENAHKQAERDAVRHINRRIRELSLRLLEVVDNLERALAHAPEGDALRPGLEATLRQLHSVLQREGVFPIVVDRGAPFDPQFHEAMAIQEADVEQATVAEILQNGYMFNGQLLRPTRVVVAIPHEQEH